MGLTLSACTPPHRAVTPSGAQKFAKTTSIPVRVPYAATLLNALEATTLARDASPYRSWIVGQNETADPVWLRAYRSLRLTWQMSPYYRHLDASFVPHMRCAYRKVDLTELTQCVERALSAGDTRVVAQAIAQADAALRPRWPALRQRLSQAATALRSQLRDPRGEALHRRLRHFAQLSPYLPLQPAVVIVAAPASAVRLGRREDRVLVLEVSPDADPFRALLTTYHEFAHLAIANSPVLDETEAAFAEHGYFGQIAANYWNETVATTFEHLAARHFDPEFSLQRELYGDVLVDRLARALYGVWWERPNLLLGTPLARVVTDLTRRLWPTSQWRLSNFLFRTVVYADSAALLFSFRHQVAAHAFWGVAPLPQYAQRPPSAPQTVPRLLLVTRRDLDKHRRLLEQFGLASRDAIQALQRGPFLFRSDDPAGVPMFVLGAADNDRLQQVLQRLDDLTRRTDLLRHGLHSLRLETT